MEQIRSEDYAEKICCPTCFEQYDDMARVPLTSMFHGCGHTLCARCLPYLLKGKPACPVCRAPCSTYQSEWSENFNLIDLLPTLKENQQENSDLRSINKKLEEQNAKWMGRFQLLTGKPAQKRVFSETLIDRPESMSAMFQSRQNMPPNWIVNWQFHEASDVVNDLCHDNYILEKVNGHLEAENERIREDCERIEWTNRMMGRSLFTGMNGRNAWY